MEDRDNKNCALLLLFLSDGKPSDKLPKGETPQHLAFRTKLAISLLAASFGSLLTVGTIGFGGGLRQQEQFSLLREMAETATAAGARGMFLEARDTSSLRPANGADCAVRTTGGIEAGTASRLRAQQRAKDAASDWQVFWAEPNPHGAYRVIWKNGISKTEPGKWVPANFLSQGCAGFSKKTSYFAKGAERMVFALSEVDKKGKSIGPALVAKKPKFEKESYKLKFHTMFARAQGKENRFAKIFNGKIHSNLKDHGVEASKVATITFLDCSAYIWYDHSTNQERGVLVEKMLDHNKYTKWNNNNGFVLKKAAPAFKANPGQVHDLGEMLDEINRERELNPVEGQEAEELHAQQPLQPSQGAEQDDEDFVEDDDPGREASLMKDSNIRVDRSSHSLRIARRASEGAWSSRSEWDRRFLSLSYLQRSLPSAGLAEFAQESCMRHNYGYDCTAQVDTDENDSPSKTKQISISEKFDKFKANNSGKSQIPAYNISIKLQLLVIEYLQVLREDGPVGSALNQSQVIQYHRSRFGSAAAGPVQSEFRGRRTGVLNELAGALACLRIL
eukprot:g20980.t1